MIGELEFASPVLVLDFDGSGYSLTCLSSNPAIKPTKGVIGTLDERGVVPLDIDLHGVGIEETFLDGEGQMVCSGEVVRLGNNPVSRVSPELIKLVPPRRNSGHGFFLEMSVF